MKNKSKEQSQRLLIEPTPGAGGAEHEGFLCFSLAASASAEVFVLHQEWVQIPKREEKRQGAEQ